MSTSVVFMVVSAKCGSSQCLIVLQRDIHHVKWHLRWLNYKDKANGSKVANSCRIPVWYKTLAALKKTLSGPEHMLLLYLSALAFTDVQGANSIDTNAPIYHQRCRFMNWALIRRSLEAISMLSKMKLHSCFKQFSTLTQKGQQHYWIMFTYNLFFAQQNFNLYLWMIQWTVVRDN